MERLLPHSTALQMTSTTTSPPETGCSVARDGGASSGWPLEGPAGFNHLTGMLQGANEGLELALAGPPA